MHIYTLAILDLYACLNSMSRCQNLVILSAWNTDMASTLWDALYIVLNIWLV